jgi:hypothetical protein
VNYTEAIALFGEVSATRPSGTLTTRPQRGSLGRLGKLKKFNDLVGNRKQAIITGSFLDFEDGHMFLRNVG